MATENSSTFRRYTDLDVPKSIWQISYVWIDGSVNRIRFKTRTVDYEPIKPEDCPVCTFSAYSCGWTDLNNSDMYLKPVALFRDPFRGGRSKLVLCEVYETVDSPAVINTRASCYDAMRKAQNEKVWFGIEQEYWIVEADGKPLGCANEEDIKDIGLPSCGIGIDLVFGRHVAEAHYRACLYAGVKIDGFYSEYVTGQWEFQIGPCEGINTADHLWMARFIMARVAEDFGVRISYDDKPVGGDYVGSTAHTNISTARTRKEGGISHIHEAIAKLGQHRTMCDAAYIPKAYVDKRQKHIVAQTDTLAPTSDDTFSTGIGDRGATMRIPLKVADEGCGYFEDRRPPANCDPYSVTEAIVRSLTDNVKREGPGQDMCTPPKIRRLASHIHNGSS